jgi:hypothetical protein
MAVAYPTALYAPCQSVFSRPVTFTSKLGNSYTGSGRGIYSSDQLNIMLEDNSLITDQHTILDILFNDYPTMPVQGDTVTIPADPVSGKQALGDFQIVNMWHNGENEWSLQLRRVVS